VWGSPINPRPIKGGTRPKGGGQFKIETGRMAREAPKYSRQEGTGQISPELNPDLSVDRPYGAKTAFSGNRHSTAAVLMSR